MPAGGNPRLQARRGDKLEVDEIGANTGKVGDYAFNFIDQNGFSAARQHRLFFEVNHTVVEANATGNSGADMQIELAGHVNLAASDFVLVFHAG